MNSEASSALTESQRITVAAWPNAAFASCRHPDHIGWRRRERASGIPGSIDAGSKKSGSRDRSTFSVGPELVSGSVIAEQLCTGLLVDVTRKHRAVAMEPRPFGGRGVSITAEAPSRREMYVCFGAAATSHATSGLGAQCHTENSRRSRAAMIDGLDVQRTHRTQAAGRANSKLPDAITKRPLPSALAR